MDHQFRFKQNILFSVVVLIMSGFLSSFAAQIEDSNTISFDVDENTPKGNIIGDIRLQLDPKPALGVTYSLSDSKYFLINSLGQVLVNGPLDRDNDRKLCASSDYPDSCIWLGLALPSDTKSPLVSLEVTVNDINDNIPTWAVAPVISIAENSPKNTSVDFPLAVDRDLGPRGIDHYAIFPLNPLFTIHNIRSGSSVLPRLIVKGVLDRETTPWHNLTVIAVDGAAPRHTGSTLVAVKVTDENDCAPVFNASLYSVTIDEDTLPGRAIPIRVMATDADEEGPFSRLTYKFSLSTPQRVRGDFEIIPDTGVIRVRRQLNYNAGQSKYEFQIVAEDAGSPPKSAEASVEIQIRDRNNNAPNIKVSPRRSSGKDVEVDESVMPGQIVASVTVRDKDMGLNGQFSCSLDSKKDFHLIHSGTIHRVAVYELQTTRHFDRETRSTRHVKIMCQDQGEPMQTSEQIVSVKVIDVNDNRPRFSKRSYILKVSEGNELDAPIGRVSAADPDEGVNSELNYTIIWPKNQGVNPFVMNRRGEIIAKKRLDREEKPKGYRFHVLVSDSGTPPLNDTAIVKLELIDINDCSPKFTQISYKFQLTENPGRNFSGARKVGQVSASDCDLGPNALITYMIRPHGSPFSIRENGDIFTNRIIDRERQAIYVIHVCARDSPVNGHPIRTSTATVTVNIKDVNDNPPIFTYPNMTSAQIRVSFREVTGFVITRIRAIDADTGDNAKIKYVITKGNLYKLFQLQPYTGELVIGDKMGSVHKGTISLTIQATDSGHPALSRTTELNILVDDSPPIGHQRGDRLGPVAGIETNQLIIICIVVATGIICAVLITAISIMARRTPCVRYQSGSNDINGSPSKMMTSLPLYKRDLDPMNGGGGGGGGSMGAGPNGCQLGDRLLEYRMQNLGTAGSGMETFLGPTPIKLEEGPDSDGDSGRGGSESNIKLGQVQQRPYPFIGPLYTAAPHHCINQPQILESDNNAAMQQQQQPIASASQLQQGHNSHCISQSQPLMNTSTGYPIQASPSGSSHSDDIWQNRASHRMSMSANAGAPYSVGRTNTAGYTTMPRKTVNQHPIIYESNSSSLV